MQKIKWIFLFIIVLSLTACSSNNIDKAQEYAENGGEYEKAEKLFLKFIHTDKAEEAYKGLFSIYIETDNIEDLRENLVAYNKLDFELENKEVYLK